MRSLLITAAVSCLAVVSACGSDTTPTAAPPAATVTVTSTPTPTPAPEEPENENVAEEAPAATSWVMPNVVGKVLQTAQDTIQALTDNPFFYTSSEDAAGLNRFQVLDSNWKVCRQTPKAGTRFNDDTDITFYAVKLEETCP